MAPDNLCTLLRATAGSDIGQRLCQQVAEVFVCGLSAWLDQHDAPANPAFCALWDLLRLYHTNLDAIEDSSLDGAAQVRIKAHFLLWASRYATGDMREAVRASDADRVLQRCLLDATRTAWSTAASRFVLAQLWLHAFLPLFPTAHAVNEDLGRVALHLACELPYPPPANCPTLLVQLCAITHSQPSIEAINFLTEHVFTSDAIDADTDTVAVEMADLAVRQLVAGLLSPSVTVPLPLVWQRTLLRLLPSATCIPVTCPNVSYMLGKFEAGLRSLPAADDVLAKAGESEWRTELRTRFRQIHGCASAAQRGGLEAQHARQQDQSRADRIDRDMRYIRVCTPLRGTDILRYYTPRAGREGLIALRESKDVTFDEYKNPVGSEFDLGKTGAFRGFSILVGNFFRNPVKWRTCSVPSAKTAAIRQYVQLLKPHQYRLQDGRLHIMVSVLDAIPCEALKGLSMTEGEENELGRDVLRANIEGALREKGFDVHFVEKEGDFVGRLDSGAFTVAWVLSGMAQPLLKDCDYVVDAAAQPVADVAEACHRFYSRGGGLFVFAENEPFVLHANAILQRLFGSLQLAGNNPGGSYVVYPEDTIDLPRSCGALAAPKDFILTGIQTLFEGETVCAPTAPPPRWSVLATGGFPQASRQTPKPLVLTRDNLAEGRGGRVVVDMGFTKLWLNWTRGGTDRYVKNASGVARRCGRTPAAPREWRSHLLDCADSLVAAGGAHLGRRAIGCAAACA